VLEALSATRKSLYSNTCLRHFIIFELTHHIKNDLAELVNYELMIQIYQLKNKFRWQDGCWNLNNGSPPIYPDDLKRSVNPDLLDKHIAFVKSIQVSWDLAFFLMLTLVVPNSIGFSNLNEWFSILDPHDYLSLSRAPRLISFPVTQSTSLTRLKNVSGAN